MIAFGPSESLPEIEKGIESAGGEILKVKTNAEGVRVEDDKSNSS
jgi:hypothetical protein